MAESTLGVSRKNKDHDWAFNLRAYFYDSDSEDDVAPSQSHKGAMQTILNDFDLSSREEAVIYKPNPFSIAKVNAAYRSARKKDSENERDLTTDVSTDRYKKPSAVQTKITDTFQTQVLRRTIHSESNQQKKNPGVKDATFPTEGLDSRIIPSISSYKQLSTKIPSENAHIEIETAPSSIISSSNDVITSIAAVDLHTGESGSHLNNNRNLAGSFSFSSPLRPQVGSSRGRNLDMYGSSPLKPPSQSLALRHVGSPPVQTLGAETPGSFPIKQKEDYPVVGMQGCQTPTKSLDFGTSYHKTFVSSPSFDDGTPPRPPRIQVESLDKVQVRRPGVSKPIQTVPKKRPTRDAYNFSVADPDDEWTTLPSRKKHKSKSLNQSSTSASFTKPFRLPGLQLPSKVAKINANNATGRRIITYLPPPMPPPVVNPNKRVQRGHASPFGDQDVNKSQHDALDGFSSPVHIDATNYPSPRSARKVMHSAQVKNVIQEAYPFLSPEDSKQVFEDYHPLSPPTSDPVMHPEDDTDTRIGLDPQIVREKYPQVRAALRKRRANFQRFRDVLGLESCGVIYKDVDGSKVTDENREIGIVLWPKCL